jgi:hypothetical protein
VGGRGRSGPGIGAHGAGWLIVVPLGTARGTYPLVAVGDRGDSATVAITVANRSKNQAPVAVDDDHFGLSLLDVAVLANDADPDGDALTITSVGRAKNGTARIVGGAIRYSANSGYRGEDAFTYEISDGRGGTARASVTVAVGSSMATGSFGLAPNNIVSFGGTGNGGTSAERPLNLRTQAPVAGPYRLLDLGPQPNKNQGWVIGGYNMRTKVPPSTPANAYLFVFRAEPPAVGGKKSLPATTTAYRNGLAVPACTSSFGSVASPDPCVARNVYDPATNQYVVSIRTSAG